MITIIQLYSRLVVLNKLICYYSSFYLRVASIENALSLLNLIFRARRYRARDCHSWVHNGEDVNFDPQCPNDPQCRDR